MRRVTSHDLYCAANVLKRLPEGDWHRVCEGWIADACIADKFRKRTGRRHPQHGAGFLADVVGPPCGSAAGLDDTVLRAHMVVCAALLARRGASHLCMDDITSLRVANDGNLG